MLDDEKTYWQSPEQMAKAEQVADDIAAQLREQATRAMLSRPGLPRGRRALARMLREYAGTIDSSAPSGVSAYQPQAWRVLLWSAGGLLRIAREGVDE